MPSIISCKNITKKFGMKDNTVIAVKAVTFDIEAGDFVLIHGKSGSGKSTLMHMLAGLENPTAGKVDFMGRDLYTLSENERNKLRRSETGFIFQSFNLLPELTAYENIMLPISLTGGRGDEPYIKHLSALLEIDNRLMHYPHQLSGGQQQKVAIARALVNKANVIFADEPTGNLDSNMGIEVMRLLRRLKDEFQKTIVLVSHDQDAQSYADTAIELADGCIYERKSVHV